jgi:hypothetical protein
MGKAMIGERPATPASGPATAHRTGPNRAIPIGSVTVPSPSKVEDSLVRFVPEPIECWCAGKGTASAVTLPRRVLVAIGRERVYVFGGPLAEAEAVATLDRGNVSVAHSGKRYRRHRLVLIERGTGRRRSYTLTVSGFDGGGLRRLEHAVALLRS